MLTKEKKIQNLLGLARKAGKMASGEFQTERAVKSGKARLVFIASDASDNTKKKFGNMCTWYHVPSVEILTKEELGHCMGLAERSCAAVVDSGFAQAAMKINSSEETRR